MHLFVTGIFKQKNIQKTYHIILNSISNCIFVHTLYYNSIYPILKTNNYFEDTNYKILSHSPCSDPIISIWRYSHLKHYHALIINKFYATKYSLFIQAKRISINQICLPKKQYIFNIILWINIGRIPKITQTIFSPIYIQQQ